MFFWLRGCCCFLPSCSSKNFLINSYIWLGCQDFFFFSLSSTFFKSPSSLLPWFILVCCSSQEVFLPFIYPLPCQFILNCLSWSRMVQWGEHWNSRRESERFATKILTYGLEFNLTNMIDILTRVPYRKHKDTVCLMSLSLLSNSSPCPFPHIFLFLEMLVARTQIWERAQE